MGIKRILAIIVVASAVLGALMLAMAMQKFPHHSLFRQVMFGLSGAMTTLSVGAGALFLLGRKDFKAGPRKAYVLLCAGIIFFGISQIQFPLIEYFNLRPLLSSFGGLMGVPYLLSVVFTIWGMRILVRSLGIKTRWASLFWMISTATVVAVLYTLLSTLLPHSNIPPETFTVVQLSGAFAVWETVLYLFAARLAWYMRKEVGALYKQTMVWLFVGLVVVGFGAVHLHSATRLFHDTWYEQDSISTLPLFAASVLFVAAGYSTLAIRQRFEAATVSASGNVFLDVVMYAANLVSTPRDIDPELDVVRRITASSSGKSLTPAQEWELCQTYSVIEGYLINREPMRPFNAASLREQIAKKFNLDPALQSKLWG